MNPSMRTAGIRPAPRLSVAPGSDSITNALLWGQGLYYLVTGLWPLISIDTFQKVTGHKTDNLPTGSPADHWLVMTVAVLIIAIAAALLTAALRRSASVEMVVLAIGAAVALTAIDVIYVWRQVILPIYLLDAVAEVLLVVAWLLAWGMSSHRRDVRVR